MSANDGRILLSQEEADRKAEEKRNVVGITFERMSDGMIETRVASTVEHIAAFFNSSDEGPNAKNKQDFGWRLSPEDLIELEELKNDQNVMEKIAAVYQIPIEDVADYNVLKYMASKRFKTASTDTKAESKDYESDYDRRVRELREKKNAPVKTEPTEEEIAEAERKKQEAAEEKQRKADEAKAKKEAEKQAKADEAAKKKAEEEAKKTADKK